MYFILCYLRNTASSNKRHAPNTVMCHYCVMYHMACHEPSYTNVPYHASCTSYSVMYLILGHVSHGVVYIIFVSGLKLRHVPFAGQCTSSTSCIVYRFIYLLFYHLPSIESCTLYCVTYFILLFYVPYTVSFTLYTL